MCKQLIEAQMTGMLCSECGECIDGYAYGNPRLCSSCDYQINIIDKDNVEED